MIREPLITADEAHLIRAGASDILIFSPPSAPRPTIRLRLDGQIRGLFLSSPAALPEGTTNAKPVAAAAGPAVAVWMGERKGAPASLALYTLASLLGNTQTPEGDDYKTESRDMPTTTARKAFYKADKLSVKWNNAGTMVSNLFLPRRRFAEQCRLSSLVTQMSTLRVNPTTGRRICTSWLWTALSMVLSILVCPK